MKRKNMEPDIRFPDTQAVVHGDETLLSRAFENIIANAVKHGHEGSSVTVATAWIDPSPARKREPVSQQTTGPGTPAGAPHDREAVKTLQVDVTNVGPVIAPDRREAIFEAFRREDSSRSTPGLGLGLSIARRVLERHGGTVRVEHSDEHYTRFRAVTPVHPPAH
jgi:signal transduction histidine kinase